MSQKPVSFIKQIGAIALLCSVQSSNALRAESVAEVNAQIEALAHNMHQAMAEEGVDTMSRAELRESIASHLANLMPGFEMVPTEKDFVQLEHKRHHHHHSKQVAPKQ